MHNLKREDSNFMVVGKVTCRNYYLKIPSYFNHVHVNCTDGPRHVSMQSYKGIRQSMLVIKSITAVTTATTTQTGTGDKNNPPKAAKPCGIS